jgi:hypothetical protein
MKVTVQQPLWEKIQHFRIDDPDARTKFSNKLASQNNWTPTYAQRVIEEYRRFMFLCSISPKGASPSYDVDQAWHLHLTYTQNYWKDFCRDTVGKEIHHHPSKGGTDEDHKHTDWYADTLQLYAEVFEEKPPGDIWPPPGKTNILEPDFKLSIPHPLLIQLLILLLLPFSIALFFGKLSVFHLEGEDFLVFFAILAAASFIGIYLLRRHITNEMKRMVDAWISPDTNAFQLTHYLDTRGKAIQTAMLDLVHRTILEPTSPHTFVVHRNGYQYQEWDTNPLIRDLLKLYKDGDTVSYTDLMNCYDRDVVYHEGLDKIVKVSKATPLWIYFIPVFVFLVWLPRVIQGFTNHQATEILGLSIFLLGLLYYKAYRGIRYKRILLQLKHDGYHNHFLGEAESATTFVNQYALLGLAVLPAGLLYDSFIFNRDAPGHQYSQMNSSGGCGSGGSCGSGGDGGGCGGGGCGGCGGD